ncbi:MAG: TRAP transporter permease [Hyphomonadaceae bacterium JAD_PAG50586_4]|nr:MAG: TRAP transporter permease [Hyphomonadaceae bacterium JAD_PAG50586_4]
MIKPLAGLAILAPLAALAAGVGLAWAMGAAGVLAFVATDRADFLAALPQRAFGQIDVFALMAMPMFILVGELMNRGGITRVLIDFSTLLVGARAAGSGMSMSRPVSFCRAFPVRRWRTPPHSQRRWCRR